MLVDIKSEKSIYLQVKKPSQIHLGRLFFGK